MRSRALTAGEKAGLAAVMFFATAGVVVFALTLPAGTQVAIGVAWGLVVAQVARWAETLDG